VSQSLSLVISGAAPAQPAKAVRPFTSSPNGRGPQALCAGAIPFAHGGPHLVLLAILSVMAIQALRQVASHTWKIGTWPAAFNLTVIFLEIAMLATGWISALIIDCGGREPGWLEVWEDPCAHGTILSIITGYQMLEWALAAWRFLGCPRLIRRAPFARLVRRNPHPLARWVHARPRRPCQLAPGRCCWLLDGKACTGLAPPKFRPPALPVPPALPGVLNGHDSS